MNEFLQDLKENIGSHKTAAESNKAPPFHSGSGVSSPYTSISATGIDSPNPDPNGLRWPDVCARFPAKKFFPVVAVAVVLFSTRTEDCRSYYLRSIFCTCHPSLQGCLLQSQDCSGLLPTVLRVILCAVLQTFREQLSARLRVAFET